MEENVDNILEYNGQNFIRNGREVTEAETQNLIASAQALTSNPFFLYLLDSISREGYRRFEIATDWETARFGKSLLYVQDVLRQKVVKASKLPIPKTTPQADSSSKT